MIFKRDKPSKTRRKWPRQKVMLYWLGWLLAAVFLLFLARLTTIRFAVLMAALMVLVVFVAIEVMSRRQWERRHMYMLERQDQEYARLAREIARNRNELFQLKRGLAETGRLAAHAAQGSSKNSVEERMLLNIVQQLTALGNLERPEGDYEAPPQEGGKSENSQTYDDVTPHDPTLRAVPKINAPPAGPDDETVLKLLRRAVNEDRVDIFLQPIVNLPQRKLRFYEMLSRIRSQKDEYIPARRYIELAMQEDLLPAIDNLLLLRALQLIRDVDPAGSGERGYFCNISPLTLSDAKFMGDLVEFISQNRYLAPRLIFELSQKDIMDPDLLTPEMDNVLNGLARLGCRFSMDGIDQLPIDSRFLNAKHIRYVKIDAPVLLQKMAEQGGFQRLRRMKDEFDRNGIDLIVTHIEAEKELIELLDLEIDYGQGFLFGAPEKTPAI